MDALPSNYLTPRQRVVLAFSVWIIFEPIRIYQNVPFDRWDIIPKKSPFFLVEAILTFVFLLVWVYLMDRFQEGLSRRLRHENSGELRLPAQLISLVIAVFLALLYNEVFDQLHRKMEERLTQEFPRLGQSPVRSRGTGPEDGGQRRRMNNGLLMMAFLSAFYMTANRRAGMRIQRLQVKSERLEKEAVQSQFEALKNQVNPHFLFNSLSILSSLVDQDTRLAGQFINRLSKAYRYILEQRENEKVSLRTELEFIAAYTFLLTIRFEDKLFVSIEVPEEARDRYSIAPLTLQLLVENAVKHNRLSEEEPLLVTIDMDGDFLRVSNPIQPRPDRQDSTGVGLENITNRYRLLTTKPVWVGEEEGAFIVKIPLL